MDRVGRSLAACHASLLVVSETGFIPIGNVESQFSGIRGFRSAIDNPKPKNLPEPIQNFHSGKNSYFWKCIGTLITFSKSLKHVEGEGVGYLSPG